MTLRRLFPTSQTLLIAASLAANAPLLLEPSVAVAQTTQASGESQSQIGPIQQRPRIDVSGKRGSPRRRLGGGSRVGMIQQGGRLVRRSCVSGPHAIAMVAPADNVTVTTSAQPSLMMWVDQSMQTKDLEFALRQGAEGNGSEVYRKLITLPDEAGWVTLDLAALDDAPSLTQGEDYYVYLSLVCDASDRSKDMVAEGRLNYIDAELWAEGAQQPALNLAQATNLDPFSAVERSLELGLWHDAMVQLNHLRRQGQTSAIQQQAQQRWQQLLEADDELYVLVDKPQTAVAPLAIADSPELDLF